MKRKISDSSGEGKTLPDDPDAIKLHDPLSIFSGWMKEAISAGEKEPEAMALATCGENGRPAVRMVLFKGFSDKGLIFYTNYESRKSADLKINPFAALLFYWPELYRQVRIEGKVRKVPGKISDRYFSSRPLENQISASVSPQSAVIPDRMFLEAMYEGLKLDLGNKRPPRPENWGGFILEPDRIEFWEGRTNRLHDRILYRKTRKSWICERLAP